MPAEWPIAAPAPGERTAGPSAARHAAGDRRLAAVVESLGTVITLLKSSKNAFPEAFGTELLSVAVRAQVRLADVRFDAADLHEMQEAQRP